MEECNICFEESKCKEFPCCKEKYACITCLIKMKNGQSCPFCRKTVKITRSQSIDNLINNNHLVEVRVSNRAATIKEISILFFIIIVIFLKIYGIYPISEGVIHCRKKGTECNELESFDSFVFGIFAAIMIIGIYANYRTGLRNFDNDFCIYMGLNITIDSLWLLVFYVREYYKFITSYTFLTLLIYSIYFISYFIKYFISEYNDQHPTIGNIFIHFLPSRHSTRQPSENENIEVNESNSSISEESLESSEETQSDLELESVRNSRDSTVVIV